MNSKPRFKYYTPGFPADANGPEIKPEATYSLPMGKGHSDVCSETLLQTGRPLPLTPTYSTWRREVALKHRCGRCWAVVRGQADLAHHSKAQHNSNPYFPDSTLREKMLDAVNQGRIVMKRFLILLALASVAFSTAGCRKQMQDLGIVPEDKPEVFDKWVQDFTGRLQGPDATLDLKPELQIATVKVFACVDRQNYYDYFDPVARQPLRSEGLYLCGADGNDVAHSALYALPLYTEVQPGLTTPYAMWNYYSPRLSIAFANLPPVYQTKYMVEALPQ